jgi:pimeloyl-ACP methyl ester carboxylesterase
MPQKPYPDVIVLVPGILGSVLRKDGKEVWGWSGGTILRGLKSLGQSINDLAISQDSPKSADLNDGVTVGGLLPDMHLVPGLWKIDGYSRISQNIKRGVGDFEIIPDSNYFEFPYDWRRDNRAAARVLAQKTRGWLDAWKKTSGNKDARLIIVAHSMGGIVARYFLEVFGGWRDTRALISFGTPYRGSLSALDYLVNGYKKFAIDLTSLIRSFTSVYQLLPIYPCYDSGDGKYLRVDAAPGPRNLDIGKAKSALDFHREIEAAVSENQKDEQYSNNGCKIYPFVGIGQPTLQSARRDGGGIEMLESYQGKDLAGDGTVPRVSATPIELSKERRERYAAERHASLQNSSSVLFQIGGILTGEQIDLSQMRLSTFQKIAIALAVDDAYSTSRPVIVRARPQSKGVRLTAVLVDIATGNQKARKSMTEGDNGWQTANFGLLENGAYRVTIGSADTRVTSVTDVFTVFETAA